MWVPLAPQAPQLGRGPCPASGAPVLGGPPISQVSPPVPAGPGVTWPLPEGREPRPAGSRWTGRDPRGRTGGVLWHWDDGTGGHTGHCPPEASCRRRLSLLHELTKGGDRFGPLGWCGLQDTGGPWVSRRGHPASHWTLRTYGQSCASTTPTYARRRGSWSDRRRQGPASHPGDREQLETQLHSVRRDLCICPGLFLGF